MKHREIIKLSVNNTVNTLKEQIIQYDIILTANGPKILKKIKKRKQQQNRNKSFKNKIFLKIYKSTNEREHIKIKRGENTKISIHKSKTKQQRDEDIITKGIQRLSIKRNNSESTIHTKKKPRTT